MSFCFENLKIIPSLKNHLANFDCIKFDAIFTNPHEV